MSKPPHSHFDTSALAREHQFAAWRDAINVLFDYGRPQRIMLAALADRGERQLPVAADFVGTHVALKAGQLLALSRDADGKLALAVEDDHV